MPRWKKEDAKDGSLYMREWAKTEKGAAYRKYHAEYAKKWRKANAERYRETKLRNENAIRMEVFSYYSGGKPCCQCCGEDGIAFLSIDHIAGNGSSDRKRSSIIKSGGVALCYWLKKNGYPDGYQILCYNCNLAKRTLPECPHKTGVSRRTFFLRQE